MEPNYEPLTDSEFIKEASAETYLPYKNDKRENNSSLPVPIVSGTTPDENFSKVCHVNQNQETSLVDLRNNYQDTLLYNLKEHIDQSIDKKIKHLSYAQVAKNDQFKQKKRNRCYTCKPRGKVKKHVIEKSPCGNFVFHHDMNHRPIILITPVKHIQTIDEFEPELLKKLFESVRVFCGFWNIIDYTISYNCGQWKRHEHFHVKIKISDKIANRMRGDHFKRIKLEQRYEDKKRN